MVPHGRTQSTRGESSRPKPRWKARSSGRQILLPHRLGHGFNGLAQEVGAEDCTTARLLAGRRGAARGRPRAVFAVRLAPTGCGDASGGGSPRTSCRCRRPVSRSLSTSRRHRRHQCRRVSNSCRRPAKLVLLRLDECRRRREPWRSCPKKCRRLRERRSSGANSCRRLRHSCGDSFGVCRRLDEAGGFLLNSWRRRLAGCHASFERFRLLDGVWRVFLDTRRSLQDRFRTYVEE